MNYDQVRAATLDELHRPDFEGQLVDRFIDAARQRINRRLKTTYPALSAGTDTNELLTESPQIWIDGAAVEGHKYMHNGPAMTTYDDRFTAALSQLLITQSGGAGDVRADAPLQIRNGAYWDTDNGA